MRGRPVAHSFRQIYEFRPRTLRALERALIVLLVAFIAGLTPPGALATNVSGTISTNTTWTLANSPYVMTGNVTVAAGVTLTIEPGVVVQGNATARALAVNGSLSAVGTSTQPITFTSTSDSAPGQWTGLTFGSGSGSSTLKYVNVRYGGGSGVSAANGMVAMTGGTVTIEDSTFTGSSVSGLAVSSGSGTGSGVSLTLRRSKLAGNGFVGSSLHGDGLYAPQNTLQRRAFRSKAFRAWRISAVRTRALSSRRLSSDTGSSGMAALL